MIERHIYTENISGSSLSMLFLLFLYGTSQSSSVGYSQSGILESLGKLLQTNDAWATPTEIHI